MSITTALAVLGLAGPAHAEACWAPLRPAVEIDLYFGRDPVSDEQWASFLNGEVTPRFPDGLSVLDVAGQYKASTGAISRERSKLLIMIVFEPSAVYGPKVQAMIDAYKSRFHQESVLRVEHAVCAGL